VPRLEEDGATQLGTGFKELASDARVVLALTPEFRLTGAAYDYRQLDAPRTDLCPAPLAPRSECVRYEEQFRTLAYLALDGRAGRAAERVRAVVSYQNQHERRSYERPASFTVNGGRDDVHTVGAQATAESAWLRPSARLGRRLELRLRYGADLYHDLVQSQAWTTLTDLGVVVAASRGQYLDGSRYTWGGAWLQLETELWRRLTLRAGGRLSGIAARAPADPESGTRATVGNWLALVGQAGLELRVARGLALLVNVDRSFRAPNLDDLTSRQQTGPGFQFENTSLNPESALTLEAGVRIERSRLQAADWVFRTSLADAIERSPRAVADCPPATPQCAASWNRFQLVNLGAPATLYGGEAALRAFLPAGLVARATISYALGYGPNPAPPTAGAADYRPRVPLSRVPPLNGTFEVLWRHARGVYAGLGLRWASAQTRLSLADRSDARIPEGGTPGFAVLDLRAGYRWGRRFVAGFVLENLADSVYRYHGSSVNGPGRGVVLSVEGRL
jgi:iron complex outermembrane receptor protein/hemoglobin/transferrin/lactoferrin receptor protein